MSGREAAAPVKAHSTHDVVEADRSERQAKQRVFWGGALQTAVTIIGTLLLLGSCGEGFLDNVHTFKCRARQSEAKTNLKALLVSQQAYQAEYERYGMDEDIGWEPRGAFTRYDYTIRSTGRAHFIATAIAARAGAPEGDTWRVTEEGKVRNVVDGCEPAFRKQTRARKAGN